MLTVAYKGWWQTPKVHLRLALDPVPQCAEHLHETGKCELQQRFPRGRGPMLRVKGPTRILVVRLYVGGSLRTKGKITLGDLLSCTAEGITQVPFETKEGDKVEKAFVEMEQISPNPTPLPPPLVPMTFKFLSQDISPGQLTFPPAREPTPFRLKQLVEDMCGPPADKTDWSKPFVLNPEGSAPSCECETADDDTATQDSNEDTDDEWNFLLDEYFDSDSPCDHGLISDLENSPLLHDLTSDQDNHDSEDHREAESSTVLFQPLPLPRLSSADRRDILEQRWLSDDVMDLAQDILQRHFPETRGLYACGAAFTLPPLQPGATSLFLQVVNRSAPLHLDSMADYGRLAGTHWLLLSSYGVKRSGQLAVYDSMYNSLSACTTALVEQLQELHVQPPGAIMRPVQRQNDGYSCGLFALAFAFSIVLGQDPCTVRYDRASMAPHLVMCLEHGIVQPFPSVLVGRGR